MSPIAEEIYTSIIQTLSPQMVFMLEQVSGTELQLVKVDRSRLILDE